MLNLHNLKNKSLAKELIAKLKNCSPNANTVYHHKQTLTLIQAQKSIGVRRIPEKNKDKKVSVVRGYGILRKREPSGQEKVNLFVVPHRVNKDDVSCFVTNIPVESEEKILEFSYVYF